MRYFAIHEISDSVFVGYGCGQDGPWLLFDHRDETPWRRERVSVVGRTFTLEVSPRRHCTGRHDLTTSQSLPCPARAELTGTALEQCHACFTATGFNPAFYNTTQISPQQRRRNLEPHVVYLASFGAGVLKVGMTFAPRRLSRLLEQGARLGAVIGTFPDADRARDLEAHLAGFPDICEALRSARKRHLLAIPFDLRSARDELRQRIDDLATTRSDIDRSAEILHLDAHYGNPTLFDGTLTDLSETEPPAISGACLGMIGDVLTMRQGKQRYMLSLGALLGRDVQLRAEERPNRFVGQLGLPF
jgi:hypothetical protein